MKVSSTSHKFYNLRVVTNQILHICINTYIAIKKLNSERWEYYHYILLSHRLYFQNIHLQVDEKKKKDGTILSEKKKKPRNILKITKIIIY